MKTYIYPAVIYFEDDLFGLFIFDLHIVTSGLTVEEAYKEALMQLELHIGTSLQFSYDIPEASSFVEVKKGKPKNVVLLVNAKK